MGFPAYIIIIYNVQAFQILLNHIHELEKEMGLRINKFMIYSPNLTKLNYCYGCRNKNVELQWIKTVF